MGDYADDAIDRDIGGWSGRGFRRGAVLVGFGEPITLFKKPITCRRCGCLALYWAKSNGRWLPHHASADGKRFILHRCGLTRDGTPSVRFPWPRVEPAA